ncbi:MAG: asparagine synthase (glutamine-hydrolyzing) [Victivallales bacterium]|nr:asparagine synthase (glutamine-hydrolyzing) [Victivallales bacterium]
MCGIAGMAGAGMRSAGGALGRMVASLAHRGPDGQGYAALSRGEGGVRGVSYEAVPEVAAEVFLGHRRLSIIDVAGSAQPLSNEDGTVWVVFNGEIYNYLELRGSLESSGHCLKENGDTEVLVHLWEEHGEGMLEHLVGMFAFALYDTREGVLFLARDRFGQKPLYFFESSGLFFFASELQGLFESGSFPFGDRDEIAMAQFFRYGYIPSPRTAYKGVFSLGAGQCLRWRDGKFQVKRYWRPCVRGEIGLADADALSGLLDDAVRLQLRSDVPLGAFLSGGIDSALISASACRQLGSPLKTFTISTGGSWCDESEGALETAAHLGTEHHAFTVEPDLVDISAKLARHYGQPFADHSSVMTYYVSRETRKHVTVALAGDGGDELFGGYRSYLNLSGYAFFGRLPFCSRRLLALLAVCFGRRGGGKVADSILAASLLPAKGENISGLFHRHWRGRCFNADFAKSLDDSSLEDIEMFSRYYNEAESDEPVEKWMEADQRLYLADDILTKVDMASMAVSLECRAPFLDHRLAEFANKIPVSSKFSGGRTKAILRDMAAKIFPGGMSEGPKKGFSMPLDIWLREGLREWCRERIFDGAGVWGRYLDSRCVEQMWSEHQAGRMDHSSRLWSVISLVFSDEAAVKKSGKAV